MANQCEGHPALYRSPVRSRPKITGRGPQNYAAQTAKAWKKCREEGRRCSTGPIGGNLANIARQGRSLDDVQLCCCWRHVRIDSRKACGATFVSIDLVHRNPLWQRAKPIGSLGSSCLYTHRRRADDDCTRLDGFSGPSHRKPQRSSWLHSNLPLAEDPAGRRLVNRRTASRFHQLQRGLDRPREAELAYSGVDRPGRAVQQSVGTRTLSCRGGQIQ